MFGLHYIKVGPTQHVIHYQNGKMRHSGAGLAFFYYRPSSTLSVIPIASADAPFIFNALTQDYQTLAVQGQLTYRIAAPEKTAHLFDFTIVNAPDDYATEDPEKLSQRLLNLIQVAIRTEVQRLPLREAIRTPETVRKGALARLLADSLLDELGVEILSLALLAIRPTPETARALEAEARETILKQADEAVYDRRNAAVAQERRIKENELNTELAVAAKQRQIREAKVEADLAVEQRQQTIRETKMAGQVKLENERRALIEARTANARSEADAQAYAVAASLKPLQELDEKTLQLLAMQSAEPRKMMTMAFKQLAENAGKIGHLNITPDLLQDLIGQA
ncbi:MAG: SPFH domain-containing protein [Clostridia bacterium]|nr:MAG: SPFH domain-containing protein [Clostridia bacterium]